MLWERKLLLEKEMREVLDPTVGQDVAGEMRKEIHRMQLRLGELTRLQDKLMAVSEPNVHLRPLPPCCMGQQATSCMVTCAWLLQCVADHMQHQ